MVFQGILLIGRQGSGRGAVAATMVDQYEYHRLSILDAAREEIAQAYEGQLKDLPGFLSKSGMNDVMAQFALIHCRNRDFTDVAVNKFRVTDASADLPTDRASVLRAPRSPRQILRAWVDVYRGRQPEFESYWHERIEGLMRQAPQRPYVVCDGETIADAYWAKGIGLETVFIHRPREEGPSALGSEERVLTESADLVIANDGDLAELRRKIAHMFEG